MISWVEELNPSLFYGIAGNFCDKFVAGHQQSRYVFDLSTSTCSCLSKRKTCKHLAMAEGRYTSPQKGDTEEIDRFLDYLGVLYGVEYPDAVQSNLIVLTVPEMEGYDIAYLIFSNFTACIKKK